MKFLTFFLGISFLGAPVFGASETLFKCAVNEIKANRGARVNVLKDSKGILKANFIQGTTVSGTLYQIEETSDGVYEGQIKGKKKFTIKLTVSSHSEKNNYIEGKSASLEIIFPTVLESSGEKKFKTSDTDHFVCGEQFKSFSS